MGKPKKKTRRDTAEIARSVVERAIGGPLTPHENEEPEPQEPDNRNPAAVALSKLGASKGGRVRDEKLTPKERSTIARKAAQSRWFKKKYVLLVSE